MHFINSDDPLNFYIEKDFVAFVKKTILSSRAQRIYSTLYRLLRDETIFKSNKRKAFLTVLKSGFKKVQKIFTKDTAPLYLELKRTELCEALDISCNTLKKYLLELERCGYIVDVRCGLNKTNKIFLKYPSGARRGLSNHSKVDNPPTQKEPQSSPVKDIAVQPVVSESSEPTNLSTHLNSVQSIISDKLSVCPSEDCSITLLKLAKGDLSLIEDLAFDCVGMEKNMKEPDAYLIKSLKNLIIKRQKAPPKNQQQEVSKKQSKKRSNKNNNSSSCSKNPYFTNVYTHKWDLELMEIKEQIFIKNKYSTPPIKMTDEELEQAVYAEYQRRKKT